MTLYELAQLLDVEHNAAFLPTALYVDGAALPVTRCNDYAAVFCAARGARLPPLTANAQRGYLSTSPEWALVGRAEAVTRACAHETVLAIVEEQPHGHVAPLVESPPEDPESAYVSAAGARNFARCKLEQSFGMLNPSFYLFQGVSHG